MTWSFVLISGWLWSARPNYLCSLNWALSSRMASHTKESTKLARRSLLIRTITRTCGCGALFGLMEGSSRKVVLVIGLCNRNCLRRDAATLYPARICLSWAHEIQQRAKVEADARDVNQVLLCSHEDAMPHSLTMMIRLALDHDQSRLVAQPMGQSRTQFWALPEASALIRNMGFNPNVILSYWRSLN